MTAMDNSKLASGDRRKPDQVSESLSTIEEMLADSARSMTDDRWFVRLSAELEKLHAGVRIHHAVAILEGGTDPAKTAPELTADEERLMHEHYTMLGYLDRIIRSSKSIAGQGAEDQTVFILRVRELVATLRRHEAEERKLMYVALFRDTGGEGGG